MVRTRVAIVALAVLPVACASPRPVIEPAMPDGQQRLYRLVADARTTFAVPGLGEDDRTVLHADVSITIGRAEGAPSATLTFTPTRFERNGRTAEPPPAQTARIGFDERGRVTDIASPDGGELPFGGSADDLGTIFGSTIARGPVRVADRWSSDLGNGGVRRSRVAALRWVQDYRCAIVESAVTRPVERERETAGTVLRLAGTEAANVTTAFAFDAGFPVSVEAIAAGTFTVAGAPQQGTVSIESTTTLTLVTPTATERATGSRRPARS